MRIAISPIFTNSKQIYNNKQNSHRTVTNSNYTATDTVSFGSAKDVFLHKLQKLKSDYIKITKPSINEIDNLRTRAQNAYAKSHEIKKKFNSIKEQTQYEMELIKEYSLFLNPSVKKSINSKYPKYEENMNEFRDLLKLFSENTTISTSVDYQKAIKSATRVFEKSTESKKLATMKNLLAKTENNIFDEFTKTNEHEELKRIETLAKKNETFEKWVILQYFITPNYKYVHDQIKETENLVNSNILDNTAEQFSSKYNKLKQLTDDLAKAIKDFKKGKTSIGKELTKFEENHLKIENLIEAHKALKNRYKQIAETSYKKLNQELEQIQNSIDNEALQNELLKQKRALNKIHSVIKRAKSEEYKQIDKEFDK